MRQTEVVKADYSENIEIRNKGIEEIKNRKKERKAKKAKKNTSEEKRELSNDEYLKCCGTFFIKGVECWM